MRAICAATLFLEAIAIALATPVMIAVEDVDTTLALVAGLGLAVVALLTAGMLKRAWAYVFGHAVQVGAVALGFLVPVMFAIGAMFAALWATSYLLGRKIESDKAARAAAESR